MNELYEKLAAIEHERWADWQQGLHNLCTKNVYGALTIPPEKVARYEWLIETKYADLPEEEKDKDRPQVDRYWDLIPHWIPVSEGWPDIEKVGPNVLLKTPGQSDRLVPTDLASKCSNATEWMEIPE